MNYDPLITRHRRRRIQSKILGQTFLRTLDRNEKAIRRRCMSLLQRLLTEFTLLGPETFEFLGCLLEPARLEPLTLFLLEQISEKDRKTLLPALEDRPLSVDHWSTMANEILLECESSVLKEFAQAAVKQLEKQKRAYSYRGKSDFEKRATQIQQMFSLNEEEREFLITLFILTTWRPAQSYFVDYLQCQQYSNRRFLLVMMGVNQRGLNSILNGTLLRLKMFHLDKSWLNLSDEVLALFENPTAEITASEFFERLPGPTLSLEDHLVSPEKANHLLSLFSKRPTNSSHVLFYGFPGTGKTSFARALAAQLKVPAYSIVSGEANTAVKRRLAIQACVNLTNQGPGSLIVVDEADNLLNTHFAWSERGETQDKGWLNVLLDQPGVRMIWITNSLFGMEESVARRFSFSVAFRQFSRSQRIRIWETVLKVNKIPRAFTKAEIESLATQYTCTAGPVDLAVKKALEFTKPGTPAFQQAVRLSLNAHYALLKGKQPPSESNSIEQNYSLEGLNLSIDLPKFLTALDAFNDGWREASTEKVRNLNMLFHGPPGTGKSELARYLSQHLGRDIHFRQGGDLLSPYVGETEAKIQETFLAAEEEGAILVIDEADTFLFPRSQALRSWEVSFTNSFLTAMERFRGILICTTNRLDGLDEASLRRFQQKVKFDWLTPDGAVTFYKRLLAPLSTEKLSVACEASLRKLSNLAPGDFRAVRDRMQFYPSQEVFPETLLAALSEEIAVKESHQKEARRIGF